MLGRDVNVLIARADKNQEQYMELLSCSLPKINRKAIFTCCSEFRQEDRKSPLQIRIFLLTKCNDPILAF